jgi:membrane protease YdiL (CAAX protease family)
MSKTQARKSLAVFFVVLIAGSAYIEHRLYAAGDSIERHPGLIFALMWWVTVSSVVARLILRESPRDVSFRWGGRLGTRAVLVGTALPLVVGLVAYGIAWSAGLAKLEVVNPAHRVLGMTMPANSLARFAALLFLSLTIGGLFGCISAAGEEIGWRGYMLTRLIAAGVPAPIFVSGFVWALWHTPLILSGQYASSSHPALSALLFVVSVVSVGYVFAWLRLSSGSVWPCVWAHGVWNSVIQGPFDGSTVGTGLWVGESGVLTAAMLIVFAVVLYLVSPLPQAKLATAVSEGVAAGR